MKSAKFNDFFTVLLRSRLSFLRFEIGDQPREGAAIKDAGELDITVRYGNEKIAAYEAFIYRKKAQTEDHLTKVFKYNPTGQLFFSVVFFREKNEEFEVKFNEYQMFLKNTPFPERYKLQGDFDEVPEFPLRHNIFLGKTLHGEAQAIMFHLFINLAYGEK